MKKTEKIIVSVLTIALGVLLMVLQADVISILMTVVGVTLIVFGVLDVFDKRMPPAVVKAIFGVVIVLCSWVAVNAIIYLVAAALLTLGILSLYEKVKSRIPCAGLWQTVCSYACSALFVIIGVTLFFCGEEESDWIFVFSGILTVLQGGLLLIDACTDD